jgi:hypothetical protein
MALVYETFTDARTHLKEVLDAACDGVPTLIRRDGARAAVVDADRLADALCRLLPSVEAVPEGDGWSLFIPGIPVAADGVSFDQAVDEMVLALREYADDWQDHLRHAPNHRDNWGLAHFVALSDDDHIKEWLVGTP